MRILNLLAAASQVEVARKNIQMATQNLDLTRQKFEAGVSHQNDRLIA
jgi:outer membrane protein TolC